MKKHFRLIMATLLGSFTLLNAQVPSIKAARVEPKAIKIDGVLNESVWQNSPKYTNFPLF